MESKFTHHNILSDEFTLILCFDRAFVRLIEAAVFEKLGIESCAGAGKCKDEMERIYVETGKTDIGLLRDFRPEWFR